MPVLLYLFIALIGAGAIAEIKWFLARRKGIIEKKKQNNIL